jgi:hypothetical protein
MVGSGFVDHLYGTLKIVPLYSIGGSRNTFTKVILDVVMKI